MAICATPGPDASKVWVARARGPMRQHTAAILARPRLPPLLVGQPGRRRLVLADERFRGQREEGRFWRLLRGLCVLQW